MSTNEKDREVTFEIKEHIGVLSTTVTGWSRELNLVSWNGKPEKYDIREWADQHTHLKKGVTLTKEEAKILSELLQTQTF